MPIVMSDLESYKELFYNLGLGYFYLKNYDKSYKFVSEMLEIDPSHEPTIQLKKQLLEQQSEKVIAHVSSQSGQIKITKTKAESPKKNSKKPRTFDKNEYYRSNSTRLEKTNHDQKGDDGNEKKIEKIEKNLDSPKRPQKHQKTSSSIPNLISKIIKRPKNIKEVVITKKKNIKTDSSDTPLIFAEDIISKFSKSEYAALSNTFNNLAKKRDFFNLPEHVSLFKKLSKIRNKKFLIYNLIFKSFLIISNISDLKESLNVNNVSFDKYLTSMGIFMKGDLFQQLNMAFEMISSFNDGKNYIDLKTFTKFYNEIYHCIDEFGLIEENWESPDVIAKRLFDMIDIRKKGKVEKIDYMTGCINNIPKITSLGLMKKVTNHNKNDDKNFSAPIHFIPGTEEYKKFGSKLNFGSKEFTVAFNIILGIEIVNNCFKHAKKSKFQTEDFFSEYKIILPKMDEKNKVITSSNRVKTKAKKSTKQKHHTNTVYEQNNTFIVYSYFIFKSLRRIFGIDENEFLESFSVVKLFGHLLCGRINTLLIQRSMGRSGTYFFYSPNGKYLIKKITPQEFKTFQSTLPAYYDHMTYIRKIKNKSILTKYVYAFELNGEFFVVMLNIFFTTQNKIHEIFDLKGSRVARSNPKGPIYKDNDLKRNLRIGKERKKTLFKVLTHDIKILNFLQLTDYSLLLGVHFTRGKRTTINPNAYYPDGINEELFKKKKKKKRTHFLFKSNDDDRRYTKDLLKSIQAGESETYKMKRRIEKKVNDAKNQRDDEEDMKLIRGKVNSNEKKVKEREKLNEFDQIFTNDGGIISEDGKEIYYLGIIDMLTTFTLYKSAERELKTVRHLGRRKEISSQPHYVYSERRI